MAWPRCPHCRTSRVPTKRAANDIAPAEDHRYRSYRCRCGKILISIESLICDDAGTDWLESKYVTEAAGGVAGTSAPRNAPVPLGSETRGAA